MKKTLFVLFIFIQYALNAQEIKLNQIGFYPEMQKIAIVPSSDSKIFEVIDSKTNKSVFKGELNPEKYWKYSDEKVSVADFSKFKKKGEYKLKVGNHFSYPFEIKEKVHEEVAKASLKAFYYNRASMELTSEYAGQWQRKMGHPDSEILVHASAASDKRPEGTIISAPKGWYDAGDYNKYIVNSGITTYTLMALFEHYPDYCKKFKIQIPESRNSTPDLLDEIRWNLDWMLDMQDPNDGGVYHKLTELNFSAMVLPDKVTAPRYVVMKATPATLDFAAVMAMASRVYKEYDADFSKKCLKAAISAWNWVEQNPAILYQQPKDVSTGAYGDGSVKDEFAWAANELYISTQDEKYYKASDFMSLELHVPTWNNVNTLGVISLLHYKNLPGLKNDISNIEKKLLALADTILKESTESPYKVGITRFAWGSNSDVSNMGILLLQAYQLTKNKAYLSAAISQLDYILGKNATGYSFVTGYGDKTPMHIHHRPSEGDGIAEPLPGFLAGGPQAGKQDKCDYPSDLPAKCYVDDVCSYSTNEIAINWNAPLVYLLGAIEASVGLK